MRRKIVLILISFVALLFAFSCDGMEDWGNSSNMNGKWECGKRTYEVNGYNLRYSEDNRLNILEGAISKKGEEYKIDVNGTEKTIYTFEVNEINEDYQYKGKTHYYLVVFSTLHISYGEPPKVSSNGRLQWDYDFDKVEKF